MQRNWFYLRCHRRSRHRHCNHHFGVPRQSSNMINTLYSSHHERPSRLPNTFHHKQMRGGQIINAETTRNTAFHCRQDSLASLQINHGAVRFVQNRHRMCLTFFGNKNNTWIRGADKNYTLPRTSINKTRATCRYLVKCTWAHSILISPRKTGQDRRKSSLNNRDNQTGEDKADALCMSWDWTVDGSNSLLPRMNAMFLARTPRQLDASTKAKVPCVAAE